MTEMLQGDVQSSNASPSVPVDSSTSNAPNSAPSVERTFRQSELNEIVGRVKSEERERARREFSSSYGQPQETSQQPSTSYVQQNQNNYLELARKAAAEETQRLLDERIQEVQKAAHERDAQRIAHEFFSKIDAGKGKYQDFDSVMQDVNLGSIQNTVLLANNFDNTADIMYELIKNPSKIGSIEKLVELDPKLAMAEMRRLSQSIKNNEQATQFESPNEPLSQLRPTKAGAEKSGDLTVADYKRKYKV